VHREADPHDGRFTCSVLTTKGYKELVKAAPGHVANVRQLIFDPLSDSDRRALRKILGKILSNMDGC